MTSIFIFYQWLLSLIALLYNAASTLPLIITLGLVAGRRGNGAFCLAGNLYLLKWEIWLAFAPFLYFPLLFLCQIFPIPELLANWHIVMISKAGMPWMSCLLAWSLGLPGIFLAAWLLNNRPLHPVNDCYMLKEIRWPILLCLFSAFCFFCTYFLVSWPFGGWPQGLTTERAVMAIARNAMGHYFMAFCPAGAISLLIFGMIFLRQPPRTYGEAQTAALAMRWLSVWAAIGYLPQVIKGWGLTLGLGIRGMAATSLIAHYYGWLFELIFLSIAIICWFCILLSKHQIPDVPTPGLRPYGFIRRDNILAWTAFFFLVLKTCVLPFAEIAGKMI